MSVEIAKVYAAIFPEIYTYDSDYKELYSCDKIDIMKYPFLIRKLFYDTYDKLNYSDKSRVGKHLTQQELEDIINNDPDILYLDDITQDKAIYFDKNNNIVCKTYKHLIYNDFKYLQLNKDNDKAHYKIKNIILYDSGVLPNTMEPTYNINYYIKNGLYFNNINININILSHVIDKENVKRVINYISDPLIILKRFNNKGEKYFNEIINSYKIPEEYLNIWAIAYINNIINNNVIRIEEEILDVLGFDSFEYYIIMSKNINNFNDEQLKKLHDYTINRINEEIKISESRFENTVLNYCYQIFNLFNLQKDYKLFDIYKTLFDGVLYIYNTSNINLRHITEILTTLITEYIKSCKNNNHVIEYQIIEYRVDSINLYKSIDIDDVFSDLLNCNFWDLSGYFNKYKHGCDYDIIIKNDFIDSVLKTLDNDKESNQEDKQLYLFELFKQCILNKYDFSQYYNYVIKYDLTNYTTQNNGLSLGCYYIEIYKEEPPFELYSSPRLTLLETQWRRYVNNDVPLEILKYSYYEFMIKNKGNRRPKNITALYTYLSNTTENKIIFINNDNTLDTPARLRYIIPIDYDKIKEFLAEELNTNDISLLTQISNKDWEKIAGGNDRIDTIAFSDCRDIYRNRTPLKKLLEFFKTAIEIEFNININ